MVRATKSFGESRKSMRQKLPSASSDQGLINMIFLCGTVNNYSETILMGHINETKIVTDPDSSLDIKKKSSGP